ncbi:MAG: hypothetical protein P8Y83_00860 [Gammaproteobacteria bacterium]|jgi:hypothetical protein
MITTGSRLLVCLLAMVIPASAEQPLSGKIHSTVFNAGRTLQWILLRDRDMAWRLSVTEEHRILIDASLGDCRFCDGEEDGCATTGVSFRSLKGIRDPVVIVACQTASREPVLQLFDPAVSSSSPAMQITGSYYLEWSTIEEGIILIEWDGPDRIVPGCRVQSDNAFEMAPVQNRMLLDSPCYRRVQGPERK